MELEGRIIADTGPWNSVQVRLTQYYEEDDEVVLMDWQEASVQNLSWSFNDLIPTSWYDADETAVVIEVQATGSGDMVSNAAHWVRIGRMSAHSARHHPDQRFLTLVSLELRKVLSQAS